MDLEVKIDAIAMNAILGFESLGLNITRNN